jgi:colicin import membrane protein
MNDRRRDAKDEHSSVLFSLNELVVLEKERLEQEAATMQATLDAARRTREIAEQRALEAAEAARQASLARLAAEEEHKRTEAARLVAMQAAIVERARVEAEQKAKLMELETAQAHQRALATVQVGSMRTRFRLTMAAVVTLVLVVVGGGALAFSRVQETLRARELANQEALTRAAAEQARIAKQLSDAQAEADRVKHEIDAARAATGAPAAHASAPHGVGTFVAPKASTNSPKQPGPACKCRAGDSLCRETPDGKCAYL